MRIFYSFFTPLFAAILFIGLSATCAHASGTTADSPLGKKIIALDNIPLVAADGSTKHVADFTGKILVLNEWAYWCPNCLAEMESLKKLQAKYGAKKLQVILVSLPENWEKDKAYAKSHNIDFPLYVLSNSAPETMRRNAVSDHGVLTLPQTMIYDKENMPRLNFTGGRDWNAKDVETELNSYPQ